HSEDSRKVKRNRFGSPPLSSKTHCANLITMSWQSAVWHSGVNIFVSRFISIRDLSVPSPPKPWRLAAAFLSFLQNLHPGQSLSGFRNSSPIFYLDLAVSSFCRMGPSFTLTLVGARHVSKCGGEPVPAFDRHDCKRKIHPHESFFLTDHRGCQKPFRQV